MPDVTITVNGESRPLKRATTVSAFLVELGLDLRAVAVERNGNLLKRRAFETTRLNAGDQLEVVRFVQGG